MKLGQRRCVVGSKQLGAVLPRIHPDFVLRVTDEVGPLEQAFVGLTEEGLFAECRGAAHHRFERIGVARRVGDDHLAGPVAQQGGHRVERVAAVDAAFAQQRSVDQRRGLDAEVAARQVAQAQQIVAQAAQHGLDALHAPLDGLRRLAQQDLAVRLVLLLREIGRRNKHRQHQRQHEPREAAPQLDQRLRRDRLRLGHPAPSAGAAAGT